MNATDFSPIVTYLQQNWLELIGVLTGFVCVYLNAVENIWGWPIAIVSCAIYIFVMLAARLYADVGLQVVYVGLNAYGWYQWLFGGNNHKALRVTRIRRYELLALFPAGLVGTMAMYFYFSTQTDAAQPFWDSFCTAFSLVALYLQANKRLESWLLWILVDIIYVPLFFSRTLYPTAGLYVAYLILATAGFLLWRKSMHKTVVHAEVLR